MLQKIKRFALAGPSSRARMLRNKSQGFVGLIAALTNRFGGPGYLSCAPDAAWLRSERPEFSELLTNWLKDNSANAGDLGRYYALILNLRQVIADDVRGDFAELGVYKGNSAAVMAPFARDRRLFLFDTFSGFDAVDLVGVDSGMKPHFADTSIERVRALVGHDSICRYVPGLFPVSITKESRETTYAFVHLDCDLYRPMSEALNFFYERMSPGGMMVVHDYSSGEWPGVGQAVNEFLTRTRLTLVLMPDKSGTAIIRKPL